MSLFSSAADTLFECQYTEQKPPYSFSCLIAVAIDRSPEQRLPVCDIYSWIQTNFPYFKADNPNWKVSQSMLQPSIWYIDSSRFRIRCVTISR